MTRLIRILAGLNRGRPGLLLPALVFSGLLLTGCDAGNITFLDPAGPIASMQRHWFFLLLIGLFVVILPVLIGVPLCLWRYRAGNRKADFRPNWDFALPLEFLVWGVPAVVVVLFSLLVWGPERRFSPEHSLTDAPPLAVDVVALNWKWLFVYPDSGVASLDHLVIPQGREVVFRLTSDSTMQSFFIPSLGSQIYAMAGMVTHLHLLADRPGRFLGENTQFNGMGFQNQKFAVDVMPGEAFDRWIARAHESPLRLDAGTYRILRKESTGDEAAKALKPDSGQKTAMPQFAGVPEHFFRGILARYTGAPGRIPG